MTFLENSKSPVCIYFLPSSWLVSETPTSSEMHCDITVEICQVYAIPEPQISRGFEVTFGMLEDSIDFLQFAGSEHSGTHVSL